MTTCHAGFGLFALLAATHVLAQDYALSPDGSAVVRLDPVSTISATAALPLTSGYTATVGTGGSMTTSAYQAAFQGGIGGATIRALYDNGSVPAAGQGLEWVQVISTNSPLGSVTSPYLDNAAAPSKPFYSFTAANRTPGLAASMLNFYDFSKRDPAVLSTTNPVTWNAKLYPVITNGTALTVENGVSWGWTMKPAMVGSTTGTFVSPAPAGTAFTGVGTSNFSWGIGDSSSLSFQQASFNATPNTPFVLGKLTFHNGSNTNDPSTVQLDAGINFTNVPEKNFSLDTLLDLVNTPNTDDPIASADQVTLANFGYTFNVEEGATASVNIMATLSTGLSGTASGTSSGAALDNGSPFDPDPNYTLAIVGLEDPSTGGFVSGVPEPTRLATWCAGLLLLSASARGRRRE